MQVKINDKSGGERNELGRFAVEDRESYPVILSGDADGTVVADALYIVKAEPLTDAVIWAPALPASGIYQVYAILAADEARADFQYPGQLLCGQ